MPSPSYLHWALAIVSLLLPHPGSASTCRNLTNSRFGTDTPYGFSNTNIYPLETISCPNEPANRTCALPRGTYNLTIERTLNFTASPEDEDAIFELARVSYWSRTLANNRSLWDEEWNDKPRFLDTRENSPDDFSDFFFETRAGLNYTVYFVSFMRWGYGILGGCDNETLNGMGIAVRAPYLTRNEDKNNITEVAGNLIGSGRNNTKDDSPAGTNTGGKLFVSFDGTLGFMLMLSMGFMLFI